MSDCSRSHELNSPRNSPGQNTGVGSLSLLQGIFPTQELDQGLSPALQADSLPAEPPGKPKNTGMGSLSLLQGFFLTQETNRGLLHYRWILYQLSYQGSPTFSMSHAGTLIIGLPWWLRIRLQCRRHRFEFWVRKIPWRRKWQPTLVFLPGEFHGQRSLVGYSP